VYERFYKLSHPPFTLTPDPAFLYRSRQHGRAISLLQYGVESGAGFCLLTGEVGAGKTLLVRNLMASLNGTVCIGLISNTSRRMDRLLPWVCMAYGLQHEGRDDAALYQAFVDFTVEQYRQQRRVVLIIDEAQNLDPSGLEEIRVLSNINADQHMVLQTLLVGQPELRDTLRQPALRQFAQRISVDYHLEGLTLADALLYVRHRLSIAGGSPQLISDEAVAMAHAASRGVPRLVNQLCDTALVYGFADQVMQVDAELMRQVITDRCAGGVFPGARVVFADSEAPAG
jgi:type II secretory pathway predicted ATPase ExeA